MQVLVKDELKEWIRVRGITCAAAKQRTKEGQFLSLWFSRLLMVPDTRSTISYPPCTGGPTPGKGRYRQNCETGVLHPCTTNLSDFLASAKGRNLLASRWKSGSPPLHPRPPRRLATGSARVVVRRSKHSSSRSPSPRCEVSEASHAYISHGP